MSRPLRFLWVPKRSISPWCISRHTFFGQTVRNRAAYGHAATTPMQGMPCRSNEFPIDSTYYNVVPSELNDVAKSAPTLSVYHVDKQATLRRHSPLATCKGSPQERSHSSHLEPKLVTHACSSELCVTILHTYTTILHTDNGLQGARDLCHTTHTTVDIHMFEVELQACQLNDATQHNNTQRIPFKLYTHTCQLNNM